MKEMGGSRGDGESATAGRARPFPQGEMGCDGSGGVKVTCKAMVSKRVGMTLLSTQHFRGKGGHKALASIQSRMKSASPCSMGLQLQRKTQN